MTGVNKKSHDDVTVAVLRKRFCGFLDSRLFPVALVTTRLSDPRV